jgi:integrase
VCSRRSAALSPQSVGPAHPTTRSSLPDGMARPGRRTGSRRKFALAMASLTIDATLQGLRHTHVSQLIAAGLDVLTISRRIGHASPTITLAVYGHLFSNTDARAAEIMQATFTKVRT